MPSSLSILVAVAGLVLIGPAAGARSAGDPIRLVWSEGDVAGMTGIYGPSGDQPIGFIEYHQTRHGDRLSTVRVARFRDGSSDEDTAEAEVRDTLIGLSGRSIIRDRDGETLVDLTIDVAGGHLTGAWGRGAERQTIDEHVALPAGTYWGPLIFIVLRNFDANAENGRLVFRTVAPTPKPRVLDMEFVRGESAVLERAGQRLDTVRFQLNPTVHWLVDPVIRLVAPAAGFWIVPGAPPSLARFAGPRNYARQEIVIQ